MHGDHFLIVSRCLHYYKVEYLVSDLPLGQAEMPTEWIATLVASQQDEFSTKPESAT